METEELKEEAKKLFLKEEECAYQEYLRKGLILLEKYRRRLVEIDKNN